jgi:RNA polymerase sigma factor (sigma-70 family)
MSRYGIDTDHAGEVVQDAFLAYRTNLLTGRISQPSLPHLRAFIRFRVLSLLREQSRLISLDEIAPAPHPSDPERDVLHKLMIDEALERIDQRCAYILREKYFVGHTSAEIAAALHMETGNVDVLLHRCRIRCREILEYLLPTDE